MGKSAALVAILLWGIFLCVTEGLYRASGVLTSAPPGQSSIEFLHTIYDSNFPKTVFVVGDSRVGWGFSPGAFQTELQAEGINDIKPVNAGQAGLVWNILFNRY
jgi:hypothetical protein